MINLNELLSHPHHVAKRVKEKEHVIDYVSKSLVRFNIQPSDKVQLENDLDYLLTKLIEFDDKKQQLQTKCDQLKNDYEQIVKTLLDYAVGYDFNENFWPWVRGIDMSGVNCLGVSVDGKPVTRAALIEQKIAGADKALTSLNQLLMLNKDSRISSLLNRLYDASLERGTHLLERNTINLVPLHKAAEIGDLAAVTARLTVDVDLSEQPVSPLVVAACHGHEAIVKLLINTLGTDNSKQVITEAINQARQHDHLSIADYLELYISIDDTNEQGNTLLHLAVQQKNLTHLIALLERGANVNITNHEGRTPLDIAVRRCGITSNDLAEHITLLMCLLQQEPTVSLATLSHAINAQNPQVLSLLMPYVTKKDIVHSDIFSSKKRQSLQPWYTNLIHDAVDADNNRIELLQILKQNGAKFNQKDRFGSTLLHDVIYRLPCSSNLNNQEQARYQETLKLLNYLLDNGADPQLQDNYGRTALCYLMQQEDLSSLNQAAYETLLTRLMAQGTVANIADQYGNTPLHKAIQRNNRIALNCLIEHHADLTQQDTNGNTPLHLAAQHCFPEITRALLTAGADTTIQNKDGLTPGDLLETAYIAQQDDLKKNYEENKPYTLFGQPNAALAAKMRAGYFQETTDLMARYHQTKSALESSYNVLNPL